MSNNPEAYGIRPFQRTRPAYLSACREFETDSMSAGEIRRASLIWRLNRVDFAEDVEAGRNLFHRSAFITENRSELADRPEALSFLSRIYLGLEEYAAAGECMKILSDNACNDQSVNDLLHGPFTCFKISREAARNDFKVIYDCHGSVDGRPIRSTCFRFQEAVLGRGTLLPEFEERIQGVRPGEQTRFDVTFPDEYGQRSLAGQTVTFTVHVYHTLEPVSVESWQDLNKKAFANEYRLNDIQGLRQYNINLCYRVLHQANVHARLTEATQALMLINFYLKLGFPTRAAALAERVKGDILLLTHAAHLFQANGRPEKALELLDGIRHDGSRQRLIRAQALFDLKELAKSEALVKDLVPGKDVQLAELRVQLASELCLPVADLLERVDTVLDIKTEMLARPL